VPAVGGPSTSPALRLDTATGTAVRRGLGDGMSRR
jgi:hypothetical protein